MTDRGDTVPPDVPPVAPTRRSRRDAGRTMPSLPGVAAIQRLVARHPTAWVFGALGLVFVMLATGAMFAGIASGAGNAVGVIAASPTAEAPSPRPQPSTVPGATRLRTCSLAAAAADPNLGVLAAHVVDATTGEVLFDRNGATPQSTASVMKLVTAAAAIQALGPDAQLSTTVIDGSTPGTIVLVGGGDPTLSTNRDSFYAGAPLIADLAAAAMKRYEELHPRIPITTIVLDATMWDPADSWHPTWPTSERASGNQSFITALMVDGDREDPTVDISPRGTDPITRAGEAFAAAAGLDDIAFSRGAAVGTTVLAEVKSQPVSALVGQMLLTSDNTLAEMLARVVSKSVGMNASSTSLQQAIPGAMSSIGLADVGALTIIDGSGQSVDNAVSPQFIAQLLVKVHADELGLGVLYDGMPVGGQTGDLYDRFTGANAVAAGAVVAKPGWIADERSLAGIVTAADGTPLAFAFYGMGDSISFDTREALDTLTTAIFTCGSNLSNN